MNYYIYEIENIDTKMKYIGSRKCYSKIEDDNYWGSSNQLTNDIKDLGLSHFRKSILYTCDTLSELSILEHNAFVEFDAINSSNYYNLAYNAFSVNPSKRKLYKYYNDIGVDNDITKLILKIKVLQDELRDKVSELSTPITDEIDKVVVPKQCWDFFGNGVSKCSGEKLTSAEMAKKSRAVKYILDNSEEYSKSELKLKQLCEILDIKGELK